VSAVGARRKLRDELLERLLAARHHSQPSAAARQVDAQCPADPTRRAGDDGPCSGAIRTRVILSRAA
jgi:hypothetical protein